MKHKTDHTHNQSSSLYLDTLFCCYMNFDNMISNKGSFLFPWNYGFIDVKINMKFNKSYGRL